MTITFQFLVLMFCIVFPLDALAKNASCEKATVYSDKYQGKKTASGKRYNKLAMTAASSTFPLGSKILVTNKHNGRSAMVVVTDRKAAGRSIDLSKVAANKLGITGTAQVNSRVVNKNELLKKKSH